tara:strand:+ start:299 stop:544 length:246 start_codon:yes stop_codon:yes gene_type:complete
MAKVNMKEIDLSQFMLDETDEQLMNNMDRKSSPDEGIKPSVNLDMLDEATLEENITAAGDYHDYDGREEIDSLEDIGMDIY